MNTKEDTADKVETEEKTDSAKRADTSDKEETIENEEVENSSDLEKNKKHIANEFNVEGNMAQAQVFIQNLNEVVSDRLKNGVSVSSKTQEKVYDLRDKQQCAEFVEKYGNSRYLAVAIILSIFEVVVLQDLPDLEELLIEYLPEPKESDKKNSLCYNWQNPYISMDKILSVMKGKQFLAEDGRTYIGLGENAEQVLRNILEQFPILRRSIIDWLILLYEIYQYKTNFDANQIVTAFARVISVNITDAKARIFPRLYTNPNNVGLLGNLAYRLYGDVAIKEEIEDIIICWIKSDSIWLWKAACMVYSFLMEDDIIVSFGDILETVICKRFWNLQGNDLKFIVLLMLRSIHFRTLLAHVIQLVFYNAKSGEWKVQAGRIYVSLIGRGYYQVNASYPELPLVACDKNKQQQYLVPLIKQVMAVDSLRKQLYAILKAYMVKLSKYDFSQGMVNHIAAYFYIMASSNTAYRQDILYFLENCKNIVANRVYERLLQEYDKKRSVEFKNELIIREEEYQNGFFPKVPTTGKRGAAFILTGGYSNDIVVDEHTTAKQIRKGKYTTLVEVSTLPYIKEIYFHTPSKEAHYTFEVYVKAVIQVKDPITFYENRNIDVDAYFENLFSLDVKKITRKYSILKYDDMDEELTRKLSSYNTFDEATGFGYQISAVDAKPGKNAQEYVEKLGKQRLEAEMKQDARKLSAGYKVTYEDVIMTEVDEGKLSEAEAIQEIEAYYNLNFEGQYQRLERLKKDSYITESEVRNMVLPMLERQRINNDILQNNDSEVEMMEDDEIDIDSFYEN